MKIRFESVLMGLLAIVLVAMTGCLNDPSDTDDAKPVIMAEPQSISAMFGDTVSFKVSVVHDPVIEFQWFCGDTMIPYAKDSVLVFAPVSYSDTGDYFVFVSNKTGYVISQKVHLSVSGGEPVIAAFPASTALNVKDSIVLTAKVAGYSPFSFKWYKNGVPINGADNRLYTIPSFSDADSGTYFVVVTNSIGTDTSSTTRLYPAGTLFITETDFNSGSMERMSTKTNKITGAKTSIYDDVAIRSFEGYIYLIERLKADNIIKYDPSKSGEDAFLYQKKLGDNFNPYDVEFVSDRKAYIANYDAPEITVFDPSTGAFLNHIDISEYTWMPDSNNSPNASDLQLVGKYLYVLLQRLDKLKPGAPSLILKVNTFTDSIVDTIALHFKNGYAMSYANGALCVTNPGSAYSSSDGGIEMVDLSTKQVTVLFEESTLGGSPNCIVHKENNRFYVTNYIDWQKVSVIEIDAGTKKIVDTLKGVRDAYGGILYDSVSRRLYVGERDDNEMGVRIFENNVQVGATVRSAGSLAPSGFAIVR
jgi:hypothetical protein